MSDFLDEIKLVQLDQSQFINEDTEKRLIFLHHTASSSSPYGVLQWWADTAERVGAAFIIAGKNYKNDGEWKDGEIIQTFSSKKWCYHLGLKISHLKPAGKDAKTPEWLNKYSIGIELCNWGWLDYKNGKYFTYLGTVVNKSEVIEYPTKVRGYQFYHKYTDAQLESARKLLEYLCDRWDIPREYKGDKIFTYPDLRCLRGEPGIYSHVSCRDDKFDCHPQPELIQMLKSL